MDRQPLNADSSREKHNRFSSCHLSRGAVDDVTRFLTAKHTQLKILGRDAKTDNFDFGKLRKPSCVFKSHLLTIGALGDV
jgi:hypothetical protein